MPNQIGFIDKALAAALPFVPKPLVGVFAKRYVAGETLEHCISTVKELNAKGCIATVDFLGEFITQEREAHEDALMIKDLIRAIHRQQLNANVSIKLSSLGLLINETLCESLMRDICFYAKEYGVFIRIDMEDSRCTDRTIDLYLKLKQEYPATGIVLQAYMKRTQGDAQKICDAQAGHFRLCKGIYIEPEAIAYHDADKIRENYLKTAELMLDHNAEKVCLATHDEPLIESLVKLLNNKRINNNQYEFQMLLGVCEPKRDELVAKGHPVRVYVPFGHNWHGYCVRRLKENPKIAGYVLGNLLSKH